MSLAIPTQLEAQIDELISRYPEKRSASLMLLHAVQDHFGHISRDAVEWIAKKLELQPINIHELVTFHPAWFADRACAHPSPTSGRSARAVCASRPSRRKACGKL